MRVDFHVYTSAGLGKNSPAEMASIAKKRGLDAIAITDLGTLKGWKSFNPKNFTIIPGVEFLTDFGKVLILGAQKLPEKNNIDEIIDWAKDWNYLVVPSHILDKKKESIGEQAVKKFKLVEAINGSSSADACKKAVTLCTSNNVKFLSNSGAKSIRDLGTFYNTLDCQTKDSLEILATLRKGKFEPRIKFPSVFSKLRSLL